MGSSSLRGGSHVPRDVLSDSPAPLPPPSLRAHPTAASSAQSTRRRRLPQRRDRDLLQSPPHDSLQQNGGASPEVAPPPQRRRAGDTGPPTERPPPHATPGSMHVCLERLHLEADTRGPPNSVDTRAYVTISDEGEEEEEEEDSDCDVSITGIIQPPRPNGVFREGYGATDTPQREERLGFFGAAPRGRQLRVGASAADGRSGEFPKLTKEMVLAVTEASRGDDPDEVVSRHGLHCVTRQDLNTLSGISWLNDKVIDFYMSLLSESGSSGGAVGNGVAGGAAPIYAFTTFFYTRLQEGGPAAVRRWTKRVDLFACRILLVPVHHGTHWCLVVIDICKKRITYFDPLGSSNNAACRNLLRYLCEESEAKRGRPLASRDWALRGCMAPGLLALPRQSGSNDCGVFVCQFARSTALGLEPDFGQQHMVYFRWRMAWEILHARLL
ncbi:sentrin-specific protease 1-like isoform X3 [Lethenteron reissneri]|uniref:sentrin-specific protease 1-like isoform X3 n=1 Tax=Lethenteron reissneri TaxID=7753 RepID=UPI002AB65E5A|nr:sentrin-specific protease 1-like isoform X3 [Lethenteron reissneri]